jgi:SAM-dependent methyltransferase
VSSTERPANAPGDITVASYDAAASLYREQSSPPGVEVRTFLDRVARLVGAGTVLELGSGPGWDAAYVENQGPRVVRTDAAPAFVRQLQAEGHTARLLDIRSDDLGGPYEGMLANAVLLHLDRQEFGAFLIGARHAVVDSGVFAFTLKEGDGEAWSHAKLGLPRHFTYWREPQVRSALAVAGWSALSIDHVPGRVEPWLFVLARPAAAAPSLPAEVV